MNLKRLGAYFLGSTVALLLMVANAAGQASLGTASTFAVLGASTVTNTGLTAVAGNIGVSPGTSITGFPPGTVTGGAIHAGDAVASQAHADAGTAYGVLVGLPCTTNLTGQDLGSLTALTPGVYCFNSSAQLTGTLTLDAQGNPSAAFTFQIGSTLTTASLSQIVLTNGAQPGNVFWQVGSSATFGTDTAFQGNILAFTSMTFTAGATLTGRALALNGAVTMDTNSVTAPGSIQVVKNTVGANGTFAFTSNFGVSSLTTIGNTASQTVVSLIPGGNYSISETVPSGWTQTSATCTNGTPAAVTVAAGATTTCTFTNTQQPGSITVVKNTVGGNGTFAFISNFGVASLTTIGNTASQTVISLIPGGNYSISETVPSGWTQTSATCTNGTPAAVTVAAGATTTCTFTNTQQPGSITVVKNTVGGNGTFAFISNFGVASLTTIGNTASQTVISLIPGGNYSISETVPSGWTQTSASCTNGTPAAITVAAGATTICTFTNTLQQGSITVVKNTVGGNGTFEFTSNFGLTSLTTSGGTADQTFLVLAGGVYSVSETVPAGWTQTSATCTNGTPAAVTVAAGATTTCTFTNTAAAPPTVSSTVPASGAGNVAIGNALSATFSEAMNPLTINASTFNLKQGAAPVSGIVTYSGVTATFTPIGTLAPNTAFTATITTGATDLAGNGLVNNYVWSFMTGATPDTTPPTVSATSPASGATNVPIGNALSATFSEAMNPSTINTSTFNLKQGPIAVSGTVTYSGVTATFTPSSPLAPNTNYTATITTGVTDLAGNALVSTYVWSFRSGATPDTTPPTVSSTSPASGATNVPIGNALSATFSEAMNTLTINTSTFNLKHGTTSVPGTVTYTGVTAIFTPLRALAPNALFTATITTGVTDLAGNALVRTYVWSFRTGATPDTTPPTVSSTLPANGAVKVPIGNILLRRSVRR